MTRGREVFGIFLVLLLALAVAGLLQPVHKAYALGILSIQPTKIPAQGQGSLVTVYVRVDQMELFNTWDIAIQTNETALNATSINTSMENIIDPSNMFPTLECINGLNQNKQTCPGEFDGPGVVHYAGVMFNPPNAPISGILFSISYTAGPYDYTGVTFLGYQLAHSADNPPYIPHNTLNGVYGNPHPDFQLQPTNQNLALHQGTSGDTTLTVSSLASFSGDVNLTYTPNTTGITPAGPNKISLKSTTPTVNLTLTIYLSPLFPTQGAYYINITGTSGYLQHRTVLELQVIGPPDFTLRSPAGNIQVPQAGTGNTSIVVTGEQDFAGRVSLQIGSPKNVIGQSITSCTKCVATLAQYTLNIARNGSNSTTFSISIPPSSFAYNYLINVTATFVQNKDISHYYTIRVSPPPYDILGQISPDHLTIKAGTSGFATVSIASENYFTGPVHASLTLSGGTARFNETTYFLPMGGTVFFSLNVTIDAATAPGSYTALLNVYSGTGIAHQIPEPIIVESSGQPPVVNRPATILGLTPSIYLGIFGGFAVLVLLAALAYRKARLESEERVEKE